MVSDFVVYDQLSVLFAWHTARYHSPAELGRLEQRACLRRKNDIIFILMPFVLQVQRARLIDGKRPLENLPDVKEPMTGVRPATTVRLLVPVFAYFFRGSGTSGHSDHRPDFDLDGVAHGSRVPPIDRPTLSRQPRARLPILNHLNST